MLGRVELGLVWMAGNADGIVNVDDLDGLNQVRAESKPYDSVISSLFSVHLSAFIYSLPPFFLSFFFPPFPMRSSCSTPAPAPTASHLT